MKFERLFTPITINGMELKNRMIMPAMHHGFTTDGHCNEKMCAFYNERAKGGVGLIILGGISIDEYGGAHGMPSIDGDEYIPGYKVFTQGIHENGAKACAQLYHAGRYSSRKHMDGKIALSASATTSKFTREEAKEMTIEDIQTVQQKWAEAAVRAKEAGFDSVEIIACTGYLIPQFLSELTNKRTDDYGGSIENRCRFGREIVEKVRAAVGPDYPILMRVAGNDFMKGGGGTPETLEFVKVAEAAGVDLFNVTGGWHETSIPQLTGDVPTAGFTYLAHAIKQVVKVPVAASNRMNDPYVAEEVLALGKADMICLARVLVADPQWPNKVREDRLKELRKCVACNQGCLANSFFEKPMECLLNGMVGREYKYKDIEPVKQRKRILVVGGGPGGAEFAIQAAQRGHDVTLWEKSETTGGQLPMVARPSGKHEFLHFIDYQCYMMEKEGVNVVLNKEATPEEVIAESFDSVVVATGVIPNRFPIEGDEGKIPVYTAHEVLSGEVVPGKDVVIVGGGSVGCEVAHLLSERGSISPEILYFLSIHKAEKPEVLDQLLNTSIRNVSIVEMLPRIGKGFDPGTGWPLMKDLVRLGVNQYPSAQITSTGDQVVTVKQTDKEGNEKVLEIPCDTIIMAVGAKSNDSLYKALEGKVTELYSLGDSKQVGKVLDAVRDAVELSMEI